MQIVQSLFFAGSAFSLIRRLRVSGSALLAPFSKFFEEGEARIPGKRKAVCGDDDAPRRPF